MYKPKKVERKIKDKYFLRQFFGFKKLVDKKQKLWYNNFVGFIKPTNAELELLERNDCRNEKKY